MRLVLALGLVLVLGVGAATAVADATSTSTACATTTAAAHTVEVDSIPVATVGGDALSVCATATATDTTQTVTDTVTTTVTQATTTDPAPSYLFDDEFNGAAGSLPSAALWDGKTYTSGAGCPFQGFNLVHEDGQGDVVLTAQKAGAGWQCSMISGKVAFGGEPYHYEARAKLACGYGTWSGVWSWQAPYGSGGLENDLIELLGRSPTVDNIHLHNWTVSPQVGPGGPVTTSSTLCNAFHVYGADVFADRVDYYLDGTKIYTITAAQAKLANLTQYQQVANLSLNMGGSWAGTPTISGPVSMLVDYVRVSALP